MARYYRSIKDKVLMGVIYGLLFLVFLMVVYPLVYVVSSSLSSVNAIVTGQVWLLPVDFDFRGYSIVFANKQIWTGFFNSTKYMVAGTFLTLTLTILAAYPLSRKDFHPRHLIIGLFAFTMFFSGGLIPAYLLMKSLRLPDTIWIMILPGALQVWTIILVRTYFQSNIPDTLIDAAKLDGCDDIRFLMRIVLPLAKPIIAVIILYAAVGFWHSYFTALIYLSKQSLYPMQIILRNILILNQFDPNSYIRMTEQELSAKQGLANLMKFSLIVISSLPVMLFYPFVQKYFMRGVMIGAVKG